MSIQDYIKSNMPFYHVTPMSNLDSILESGIKKGGCNAICVVRSKDKGIIDEIIRQINVGGECRFAVIKILPQKHGISADMVCEDNVEEPTAPLHNYIVKDLIEIEEDDIVIMDYKADYKDAIDERELNRLTGYILPGKPEIDDCLTTLLSEFCEE